MPTPVDPESPTPPALSEAAAAETAALQEPALSVDGRHVPSVDPQMRRRWWIEVGVVICLGVLPPFWYALMAHIWPDDQIAGRHVAQNSMLIAAAVQTIPVVLYLIWRSGEGWAAFGFKRPRIGDLLLGAGLWFSTVMVSMGFMAIWPFESDWQPPDLTGWEKFWVIVGGVFNGANEEILLFAFLFPRLEQLKGTVFAFFAVPALFASYHVYYGTGDVLAIFLTGLVHAGAFALGRRIWPLIVSHALADFVWMM